MPVTKQEFLVLASRPAGTGRDYLPGFYVQATTSEDASWAARKIVGAGARVLVGLPAGAVSK